MADVFKTIDKINSNIKKMKTSIKKIQNKLNEMDLSKPNEDDFEKLADYFDDIKCISNRSMVKMDHLVDKNSDSSEDLSSLSNMSISDNDNNNNNNSDSDSDS
tara:strand:+ start:4812 stop:5120 length:309 start_codon:yes stop_codon:yes gene_type:complete